MVKNRNKDSGKAPAKQGSAAVALPPNGPRLDSAAHLGVIELPFDVFEFMYPGVSKVGHLTENQQFVTAESARGCPGIAIFVQSLECNAIAWTLVCFVFQIAALTPPMRTSALGLDFCCSLVIVCSSSSRTDLSTGRENI